MKIIRFIVLVLLLAGMFSVAPDLQAAGPPAPFSATSRTNTLRQIPVPSVRALPATRGAALTNIPAARPVAVTNTAIAKKTTAPVGSAASTNAPSGPGLVRAITQHQYFYPGVIAVVLLLLLGIRAITSKKPAKAESGATAIMARRKTAGKVHSCNVLKFGPEQRQLWQFDGTRFAAGKQHSSPSGRPLPGAVNKDWSSLWNRKLNIAWLPPEHVFFRVLQVPVSNFEETVSMVELQLEKLSPMPVTQVAWSLHVLPKTRDNMQTVVVTVAARSAVEEFLGKLEGDGYLADRLDLPVMDQLLATPVSGDGAWIYPGLVGGHTSALVAWWYDGTLQNLGLVAWPQEERVQGLKEQFMQMAWAGEMEGWLTSPPRWHLVADGTAAAEWEPALREALDQSIEVIVPLPESQVAAANAKRAATASEQGNLLPPEFTVRYQQQFVDRLWMRALLALAGVYVVGVAIYFIALSVASLQTNKVESDLAQLGPSYTNALSLKARFEVLKERQELKYAALDCWNTVAGLMPESLTLDSFNFSDGRRLTLSGSAPNDQVGQLIDFEGAMRKAALNGQPLFDATRGDSLSYHLNPAANVVTWNFSLELKRVELQ